MPNGPVNEAVSPNESGNNLYILVVDNATGAPISQGVCITGTYNTQCCNCWPSGCSGCNGCTSGNGGPVSIYTDKTGVAEWSIPFTCSGSYSLLFAKMLDFDKNLSIISIGGDYFISKRMLNGKVYRVQKGGVPFAAVHADPDIRNPDITRYGPTATMPLRLEKRGSTFFDYLRSFNYDIKTLETLVKVVSNEDIIRILETNFVYGLPLIGKRWFFENEARKIVPTIKYEQLYHERGMGGIRPQIVDENTESFFVGASKLYDNNAIFNITPSPGASSSLESGIEDMKYIARALGLRIDHKKFEAELGIG